MKDFIIEEIRNYRDSILSDNEYNFEKLGENQKEALEKLKLKGWQIVTKNEVMKNKNIEDAPSMAQ